MITIIATWLMYKKANQPGWASIIPFYNLYILYKLIYGNGWKFLLNLIPLYNIYFWIVSMLKLARVFGKSEGFGVGLIFLNTLFVWILGFGSAQYVGKPE